MVNESLIFSKENGYYNIGKLKRLSGQNILYITGLSGSGKSTLAQELEEYYKPVIYIELDWFECNQYVFSFTKSQSEAKKIVREYIQTNYGNNRDFKNDTKQEFYEKFYKFLLYLQQYAYDHPSIIFILEGVQLVYCYDKFNLTSYPLIIVNTSVLHSQIRQIKRASGDKAELLWMFKNFFSRLNQNINRDKELNKIRKLKEENDMSNQEIFGSLTPSVVQEKDDKYLLSKRTIARRFISEVQELARVYKLPFFCVTDGASGYSNNGCDAVKHARDSHIEWEKENGQDPYEDWSTEGGK